MSSQIERTRTERIASKWFGHLRGHGGFIWVTFGAIVFGFSAMEGWWWLVFVGAALTLVGVVVHVRLDPAYTVLLERAQGAQDQARESATALQGALRSILSRIAQHCELGSSHQRISIYCHVDDEFVMLARDSANPRWKVSGRTSYPGDKGVIGEAWELGTSTRRDWPVDRDEWNELQEKLYGIPRHDVEGISMQACSMVALRLTHDGNHVGVIVMESTEQRGVKSKHLTTARNSLLLASVCEILFSARPQFPEVAEYIKTRAAAAGKTRAGLAGR